MMNAARKWLGLLAAGAATALAGQALAGDFERMFFVKPGATAAAMFDDRDACAVRASDLDVEQARGYSDAEFGPLAAMASALEGDLVDGKVRATVRRVALERCMERRGWLLAAPPKDQEKALRKASRKRPDALDAWLKANEPKAPVAMPPGPAPASPPGTPSSPSGSAPADPT